MTADEARALLDAEYAAARAERFGRYVPSHEQHTRPRPLARPGEIAERRRVLDEALRGAR